MTKLISLTLILSISSLCALANNAQPTPGACVLRVPQDPLSAKGLATPYILKKGSCDQTNPNQQVFVEATVFHPATGTFSVYQPLVINEGSKPAIAPVVPTLPEGAIVGLWFGANANSVTLEGDICHSDCVNGLSHTDIFGQFAFCNANKFFKAVDTSSKVVIPPLGNDIHGQPCPTTRFFGIIDQDQSDNVITTYLQKGTHFAQNTKRNRKHLKKFVEIANGSDNALVSELIDPAIKCIPFKAPSLMEPNVLLGSMALNELLASRQPAPMALVPASDPMVLSNGKPSLRKLNAYRRGVNQPLAHSLKQASPKVYCQNFNKIAPNYIKSISKQLVVRPSPDPAAANNLLTFMGQRYAASWTNLGCDVLLKITSAITVTTNAQGVAIQIHFHQSKPIKTKKD